MTAKARGRAWIAVGALAAVNLGVLLVYTLPRRLEGRSLTERLALVRTEVERERAAVARIRRRTEALSANAADAKRFYERVGPRSSLLTLIEDVHRTSRDLGLKVTRRGYEPSDVKGLPLTRYAITMPVTGTYRQLTSFLDVMERSPHFLIVDQIALRKQGVRGEADLDVVMSAYVKAESKEAAHAE